MEFKKVDRNISMNFIDNNEQLIFDVHRNMDLTVYPEGEWVRLSVNKNRDIGLFKFADWHFDNLVPFTKPLSLIFIDKRFSNHIYLSIMLMIDSCLRNGKIGGELKRIY